MRVAPALIAIAALAGVTACRREPDFDKRYAAAASDIQRKAREIEAQVNASGTPEPPPGKDR